MSPRARLNGRHHDPYDIDGDEEITRFDDWEIDPELLLDAVRTIIRNGDGILFRATSDGGAIQVTIYRPGEEPRKKYLASVGSLTSLLRGVRGNPLENKL